MKNQSVSRSESKKLEELFQFKHEEDSRKADAFLETFKLCPLLEKLRPLYRGIDPKITRMAIALYLSFSLVIAPAFAADNVLSQNYVPPPAEMTLAAAEAQPAPAPTPKATVSVADEFVLAGALSAATVVIPGRSLYVSTVGSDTATGAEGAAFKTIAYAVSQLQAGDTLYIEEGTYQQSGAGAVFTTSGTSDAPITIKGLGNVVIQGTASTTISGYTVATNFNPAFDTKGQDYINFENLTVNNLRAAVTVSPNSSYITIDGLKSDRNHFAVLINGGDHVTVRNAIVTNSRNGFRTESTTGVNPTDILFENIDVSGSADVYTGFEPKYRNGDGFILEFGTRITLRNVVSHDNWDGGFDVKATNVLMENVTTFGNKNNFKIWGSGIVVKNSLSYGAKIRVDDPVAGEGFGINNRMGQVTFINTTFANNENSDIRADNDGGPSSTILENCIMVRNLASGSLYVHDGGSITDNNNIWYDATKPADFTISGTSLFADPKLVSLSGKDFHLQAGSPAINFGSNAYAVTVLDFDGKTRVVDGIVDLGAYEYQGALVDTVVPVISAVAAVNATVDGVSINWTTNEVSDSQVQYRAQGTTTWLNTVLNAAFVTNHSMILSGLNSNTVYEYQVKSKDQAGNLATQAAVSSFRTLTLSDTTAPVMSAIATSGITATGAVMSWVTNEASDSQVEYRVQGSTAWLATSLNATMLMNHSVTLSGLNSGTLYEFRVKSKDQAGNLATQAAVSSFTTAMSGVVCTTVMCGVTSSQTVSGIVKIQPNLTLNPNIRKVSYYLNGTSSGKEYSAPFTWGGTAGFDTRTLSDGSYTLAGAYTTATGDQPFSVTFTIKNNGTIDTTAPVISTVTANSVTTTGATISWTTNEASDSQVEYRIQGSTTWLTTSVNASMTLNHSVALSGLNSSAMYEFRVKSKDQVGNLATQAVVSNFTTATPVVTCVTAMCGVTAGQTVSGTIKIQPNLTLNPSIRKVAYYLNGTSFGKEYAAPFTWGGSNGFDTTLLANGNYVLAGAYTTSAGDIPFTISFTVSN